MSNPILTDCLIVGGGVVGLSLAYELARRQTRVTVLERGEFGREASWAGAGILPPAVFQSHAHPYDQLRGLSFNLHPEWAERLFLETNIDNGFRRCGGLHLARQIGEAAALHGWANFLRGEKIHVEQLTAADVARVEPGLRSLAESAALRASYFLPDEAQLRNPRHLQALQAACQKLGVELRKQVEIQSFNVYGATLRDVQTNQGTFSADRFCITAGAWTQAVLQQLGIATSILPIRGQMVLYQCPTPPLLRVLNEGPRYIVPRDDGHVLVGSTEEEVGFDKRTTHEAIAELQAFATSLVPPLNQAVVARTWAGLRPGSFDGFPYLGQLPGLENAFAAAGHFRSGLFLSPGTAVVLSQLMLGETPQIDLSPFRVGRG